MLETIITFVLGFSAGVAAPFAKKLITKIITLAYHKADKEVGRWFK